MPMIKGQVVTDEMMIKEVRIRIQCKGYRPVIASDLRPGQELVMVEVERFYLSGADLPPIGCAGTTRIRLDDKPVAPARRLNDTPFVFYHCVDPQWEGDCFVPLSKFVVVEAIPHGCSDNHTRYFAKR